VLLKGYKEEANHTLKSKVSKVEVEDMLAQKFDNGVGRELEKDVKRVDKRLS